MKNNMLVFNDKEKHTEIRYVIAFYNERIWCHYLDFPNIDDAKESLDKLRINYPFTKFRLFEKIEQTTINSVYENSED